jgi:hypothetical protein
MPSILTLAEIAQISGRSERSLRDLIKTRSLPVLRAGRDIRFDDAAVAALDEALSSRVPHRERHWLDWWPSSVPGSVSLPADPRAVERKAIKLLAARRAGSVR